MTPTNEEILRGNRVIAEAMGHRYSESDNLVENRKYHYLWSDLMPVIEKIKTEMRVKTYWNAMQLLWVDYDPTQGNENQEFIHIWYSVVKYFESKK